MGVSGLRLWQQPMECVCGEQEGCVEAEDDATGEGVSLTEEECGGCRRQEEKEEKEQERLLRNAVSIYAHGDGDEKSQVESEEDSEEQYLRERHCVHGSGESAEDLLHCG